MSGVATVGWLTTRTGEIDNLMTANSTTDQFTVVNNLGQVALTLGSAFPISRLFRAEMELGAAMGQMLQVQYDVKQTGGTLDQSKFYSLMAGGATLGLMVFFPPGGAAAAASQGSIAVANTLRALVISGTVNAFMTGPNFMALAGWFQENIEKIFNPTHPRTSDFYPLALTDKSNWMLYTEMYALALRTGKLKVDGKRALVTITADRKIIVTEIPEDQQTPFMGRKGGGVDVGSNPVPGGSGGGTVTIYGPEP